MSESELSTQGKKLKVRWKLADLLRSRYMKQIELSRLTGISATTINAICLGKHNTVSLGTVTKIMEALGLRDINELVTYTGRGYGKTEGDHDLLSPALFGQLQAFSRARGFSNNDEALCYLMQLCKAYEGPVTELKRFLNNMPSTPIPTPEGSPRPILK